MTTPGKKQGSWGTERAPTGAGTYRGQHLPAPVCSHCGPARGPAIGCTCPSRQKALGSKAGLRWRQAQALIRVKASSSRPQLHLIPKLLPLGLLAIYPAAPNTAPISLAVCQILPELNDIQQGCLSLKDFIITFIKIYSRSYIQRGVFHPAVYSPSDLNSQSWLC